MGEFLFKVSSVPQMILADCILAKCDIVMITPRDSRRWSWPTLTRCRCWTRGATSPSPSARRRRAGCTSGCRRASGTGSTTSSPPSTRARRGGSSGWKVPHTPATLITDSQDFMVRISQASAAPDNPCHSHIYHLSECISFLTSFLFG